MKRFLVFGLILIGLAVNAKEASIYVLPLFTSDVQSQNAYGFETTSEIVAGDIIQNFLLGKKINSPRLNSVKSDCVKSPVVTTVAEKYKKTGLIDFEKLTSFTAKSLSEQTLLVVSFVEDKNGLKLDAWDVLKLSSDFNVDYPYVLITKVILVDSNDGVALWQKTYTTPLTSRNCNFVAPNFAKAVEQYEKIRSYSKNIIVKDVEQNLNRRFTAKSIDYSKNVKKQVGSDEGIGLKYYKKGGIPGAKITPPQESFEEQLLKDESFSL